ncbi:MAG TPA: nuclear transport factor 2 family protein [Ilumatobacteraceae bacterium]
MRTKNLKQDLLDLERRGWDSLCSSTGADFYGEVMTDDGVMVLANGAVMHRADVLSSLRNAPAWAKFEMDDPDVVRMGEDAAALVYRAKAYRSDDQPPFDCVMSSVYVADGDEWKLALYQQTPATS